MVEQHCIGDQSLIVRNGSGLNRNSLEELFLVYQLDEIKTLLDGSLQASAIGTDIAEQFSEVSGFQDELAQGLVAHGGLRFAQGAWKISVQADQREVVDGGLDKSSAELPSVLGQEVAKVDLRVLLDGKGY
jgi:hypothetical protein